MWFIGLFAVLVIILVSFFGFNWCFFRDNMGYICIISLLKVVFENISKGNVDFLYILNYLWII